MRPSIRTTITSTPDAVLPSQLIQWLAIACGGRFQKRVGLASAGIFKIMQVEIMMALEEKFDLELDEERAEQITNVQQAADLIAAQVRSKHHFLFFRRQSLTYVARLVVEKYCAGVFSKGSCSRFPAGARYACVFIFSR
jgi:hypothetical protein